MVKIRQFLQSLFTAICFITINQQLSSTLLLCKATQAPDAIFWDVVSMTSAEIYIIALYLQLSGRLQLVPIHAQLWVYDLKSLLFLRRASLPAWEQVGTAWIRESMMGWG